MSRAILLLALSMLCACSSMNSRSTAGHEPRTVVITGASSGFGRGVALELAARGDNVVLAARRTQLPEEVARAAGGRALLVTTDVSNPADMERPGPRAVERVRANRHLVQHAGGGAPRPLLDL